MARSEWFGELGETLSDIYSGIIAMNRDFAPGEICVQEYDLASPELITLREKYGISDIMGDGGDFERALRLMHNFAPRLAHNSFYDNRITADALHLLEYSLDEPEHGINCLTKAKILTECLLPAGICARRVWMLPYSPYDPDSHVICEVYDRERGKWLALDPTTDCCLVDENESPLGVAETRELIADRRFFTSRKSVLFLSGESESVTSEIAEQNAYYMKNMFRFRYDKRNGFGDTKEYLTVVPVGYDIARADMLCAKYKLDYVRANADSVDGQTFELLRSMYREKRAAYDAGKPVPLTDVSVMLAPPKCK